MTAPKAIVRKSAPLARLRASISDAETVTGIHTALLTLTPGFLDALKKVAPKTRRSKIPYVIAIAMLAVLAVLGADTSTREFGIGKGRQLAARLQHKPAPAAPAPAPAAVAQAVTPADAQPAPAPATPAPATPATAAKEEAPAPVVMKFAATRKSTKPSGKSPPRPVARQVLSRL